MQNTIPWWSPSKNLTGYPKANQRVFISGVSSYLMQARKQWLRNSIVCRLWITSKAMMTCILFREKKKTKQIQLHHWEIISQYEKHKYIKSVPTNLVGGYHKGPSISIYSKSNLDIESHQHKLHTYTGKKNPQHSWTWNVFFPPVNPYTK